MSTIVLRSVKGTPLTNTEVDTNFTNLNTDKVEKTAAAITGGSINGTTVGATTATTGAFTTLAASSSVTLSGGTANGVTYLNGSKVLTSGSALTFDGAGNLTSTGAAGASSGEVDLKLVDSTSGKSLILIRTGATFNYAGIGGAEAALYTANNNLNLVADGGAIKFNAGSLGTTTEGMRLTSTGLGIGTSNINQKLVISNAGAEGLEIGPNVIAGAPALIAYNRSGSAYVQLTTSALRHAWYASSTEVMRLDSSGNLGLGVTPSAWSGAGPVVEVGTSKGNAFRGAGINDANVESNAYYNAGWKYANTGYANRYAVGNGNGGGHYWYNAASGTAGNAITFTQAMTLDASGRLGIGTTSPLAPLQINSFGGLDGNGNQFYLSNNSYYDPTDARDESIKAGYSHRIVLDNNAGGILFQTTSTSAAGANTAITLSERARIDSSGNLLVGGTSGGSGNSFTVNTNTGNGLYTQTSHPNGTGSGVAYAIFYYNASNIGSITQSGTTAVLYNTTSDQRLKENIQDADSASSLIDSLQVRKFDWKSDGTHQRYGFVAQELVTVAPEAVHQPEDTEQMMAVDYSKLVPMLVKEIQSLRQRVAQLETN